MGNTIRREPVTFDIPKSPDYRHLNITNFRGLDVSSNPFELDNNTASDCLNVYVDESNTLTTRPRLQKKYVDLLKTLGNTWQPIGYYKLHDGYLLHGKLNDQPVMKLYVNDEPLKDITGTTPTNKCKIFEQGENIYLLDGQKYLTINRTEKVIKDVEDVEGYIPTTATVDIDGNRFDVEPLNLLSDEYKESYYWDASWNPYKKSSNIIAVENDAIDKEDISLSQSGVQYYPIKRLSSLDTQDEEFWYGVRYYYNEYLPATIKINKTTKTITGTVETSIGSYIYNWLYVDCTPDKSTRVACFVCNVNNTTSTSDYKGALCVYKNGQWQRLAIQEHIYGTGYGINGTPVKISSDGNRIICHTADNLIICDYNTNTFSYDITKKSLAEIISDLRTFVTDSSELFMCGLDMVDDGSIYFIKLLSASASSNYKYLMCYKKDTTEVEPYLLNTDYASVIDFACSADGNTLALFQTTGKKIKLYKNFKNDNTFTEINSYHNFNGDAKIGVTNNFMWIYDGNTMLMYNIIVDKEVWKEQYHTSGYRLNQINCGVSHVSDTNIVITYYDGYNPDLLTITRKTDSKSSYVHLTRVITNDALWQSRREQLLNAYLNTRFDNNYWFASGNRYYRSRNNDPTYFPITEYNDLGDSNLPITGFNLANDTTLIAYKDDRLYLIQPFESSSGTREYSITEGKNTVGNTAIDAPIVTTLTEIPLQINNDGVYGLSQLSNVSATERIADLMSRPINQRWLDIPDNIIKNAQTLNRLYWTYIILPDNEKNKTSIYLLDNRTNSWYYWELPIIVLDSFVVDNRAEFADKNGEIYYLTTTDIDVPNFDDVLVTEYYDDGEKLIDWYWQSQIMYLGTINYTKRLVNTTFILTDDDTTDGYGLKYGFKVFRKLASSVPDKEISNDINLVRSTTRKTNISKFGFLQMKISNITPDDRGTEERKEFRNNKLRLVGLGLKYVLLEGLIR